MGETTIIGTLEKMLYRDDLSGNSLFALKSDDYKEYYSKYGTITVSGNIPNYIRGMTLKCVGSFIKKENGSLFVMNSCSEVAIDNAKTATYIVALAVGINQKMANQIVEKLGSDIFKVCLSFNALDRLMSVEGMTRAQANMLCEKVRRTVVERELFEELYPFKVPYSCAARLARELGSIAGKRLALEPYTIGMLIGGIPFKNIDLYAQSLGISRMGQPRLFAACWDAVRREIRHGHTYADYPSVIKRASALMQENDGQDYGASFLSQGINANSYLTYESKDPGEETGRVYWNGLLTAEQGAARGIARLIQGKKALLTDMQIAEYITEIEQDIHIRYAPAQRAAFDLLRQSGIAVVTGGPGTGKTTVVNGLIRAYQRQYPNNHVMLAAPTGRAAQRMTEATGMEATTIHRLVGMRPYAGALQRNTSENPLEVDFLVVDESSMVDIEMLNWLLDAIPTGCLLLFVGDINQLPSVGPGDVLNDLIRSGQIPVCALTAVHRQTEGSPILENAIRINQGITQLVEREDFTVNHVANAAEIPEKVRSLIERYYDKNDPFQTQVLAPSYQGKGGITEINNVLQEMVNPRAEGKAEIKYGRTTFRENDKVITLNNNYRVGYLNGDLGIITEIKDEYMVVRILDKDIQIERADLNDVSLAYCISIHKSQGSEFKNVIIALSCSPANLLQRNLLYTAITRAKETVSVIAEYGALEKCIKRAQSGKRNTRLMLRIQNQLIK